MIKALKKILLNLYFWPLFVLVTAGGMVLLPFLVFIMIVVMRMKPGYSIRRLISIYGWMMVRLIPFFAPVQVEYRGGKLPKTCIYVPNHNSSIEPYLFGALGIDAGFFTTWPFKIPFYGNMMRLAGYINPDEGWNTLLPKAVKFLKTGASLIIWPEGHRSRDGRLGRFKNGAFALSVATGYPIVPVCILGADKLLPPGRKLLTPHRLTMVMLPPVHPEKKGDAHLRTIHLRDKVREEISRTLHEHGHEHGRKHPQDRSHQDHNGATKAYF